MNKLPESSILNLLNAIMGRSGAVKRWKGGKHNKPMNQQLIRKADAKKKRKRKIAYQSKRINRLRAA